MYIYYISVYHVCAYCLMGPEEGMRSPGAAVRRFWGTMWWNQSQAPCRSSSERSCPLSHLCSLPPQLYLQSRNLQNPGIQPSSTEPHCQVLTYQYHFFEDTSIQYPMGIMNVTFQIWPFCSVISLCICCDSCFLSTRYSIVSLTLSSTLLLPSFDNHKACHSQHYWILYEPTSNSPGET